MAIDEITGSRSADDPNDVLPGTAGDLSSLGSEEMTALLNRIPGALEATKAAWEEAQSGAYFPLSEH